MLLRANNKHVNLGRRDIYTFYRCHAYSDLSHKMKFNDYNEN